MGGMPSPAKPIQLSVRPSHHFIPDLASQLSIPPSIPPESTITLEGFIRARIAFPDDISRFTSANKQYLKPDVTISMTATLPWLNRTLPDFDFQRSFNVRFPCAFSKTSSLQSVSPGSSSNLSWKVTNLGNKAIGGEIAPCREVQVQLTTPSEHSTLSDDHAQPVDEVALGMPLIGPRSATSLSQTLTILPDVRAPLRLKVTLGLYIADASWQESEWSENGAGDDQSEPGLVLVQLAELTLQVSKAYQYSPVSGLLMIINSQTAPARLVALRELIWKDLGMAADCWDVDLNGGLHLDKDGEKVHVLSMYDGKTILMLGETFRSSTEASQTVANLCDSREIRRSSAAGTSYLALGLCQNEIYRKVIQHSVFNVPGRVADIAADTPNSARFPNAGVLANAVLQQKQNNDQLTTTFMLPVKRRKYHLLGPGLDRQAQTAAKTIRKKLPMSRCLVTTTTSLSTSASNGAATGSADHIVVLLGADRNMPLSASESTHGQDQSLSALERYMVISALISKRRAQLLWTDTTPDEQEFSFVARSAICSLSTDCLKELGIYAYSTFAKGAVELPAATNAESHLRIHFPTMAAILYPDEVQTHVPRAVVDVLVYCLAACRPQSKAQILAEFCIPNGPCRKRLGKYLDDVIEKRLQSRESGAGTLASVRSRAQEIHSRRHRDTRDTYGRIVQRAAALTNMSEYAFAHATRSTVDVVPASEVFSAEQWDARFNTIEQNTRRIENEEERTRNALAKSMVTLISTGAANQNSEQA
ncbi:hypothetical protein LTR56_004626 [Elasticomyces elasticus]|nr:hypothetical protein LTR56_004626 [Elasticomyces elasticus]KAK3659855.1 hypothetical protein LTR22_008222 [Elasticomyces elasticus]KAK4925966.1 hypothetical protein LTR49_007104 [Elasticomyces elasticus]KAK5768202.1 hypothetical protein LTS12_001686 [Elasticomyces elasticus]